MQLLPKIICQRIAGALWGLLLCCVISLLAGCRSVVYVPVETVVRDSVWVTDSTERKTEIRYKDSLRIKDSVVMVVDTAGNIVSKERYHEETRARDTGRKTDETAASSREARHSETEQVPVPAEKPLSPWEKARFRLFWPLALAVAALSFITVWLARRMRKK